MKNTFITLLLLTAFFTQAQVGIGVSTATMNASAQLEVASTTKGFLAPRMTASERALIASPAAGLLVFQTDGTSGFYYYDGAWKQGLGPQGDAGVAGAAGQTNTSLLYSSISIYADGAAPSDAPTAVTSTYGNFGWYFKKTGNTRINWYIAPKTSTMKVSDLTGLYLEMFNVAITNASDMPYLIVYTKATGSGDAASWYKSRRTYTFNATPAANTKYLGFANLGATTPNTYNTNLLDLVAGITTGTFASTEEILFIGIFSSSTASTCEFVANKLGVITGTSTQEFLFMPPSSIANLSGYATTSALDLKAPLDSPTITGTGAIAGIFTGDLTGNVTGNADTATKIASITNSDIVQLTSTQTLTNKTLTSPTITGTGAIAGTFTGDLTGNVIGNAGTATKLAATKNINGVAFDGSADITVTAAAETLSGTTLKSTVTGSSLTSVGILVALEVNGAATNTTAHNAAASSTIDFTKSNLAYSSNNPSSFTLSGIKDGGTYTLAVQGTTSGTSAFSSSGFTFKSVNNGSTTSGKQTLYTFIVMGTTVYYFMAAGF
jgi:hypothetical protein